MAAILEVSGLTVEAIDRGSGRSHALVEDVGFSLAPGETLGLVGESGSGKSVTSLAVMRLLARSLRIRAGSVLLGGEDLVIASDRRMQAVRGEEIAMIFQEPMTSLNPAFTVGNQIAEAVLAHRDVSRAEARRRAVDMLDRVGIPNARDRVGEYPHAFSGGMRQRVMIAMALACDPQVLIADEPTTAVDVTIQAQILELLRQLQAEAGMAILFVTHDLGVVADICDRVCALYAGQVVEQSGVDEFFVRPRHPYSDGLLRATPQSTGTVRRLHIIAGTVPTPDALPSGCRFHPRCEHAVARCGEETPLLGETATGGLVRCLREQELTLDPRVRPPETAVPAAVSGGRSGTAEDAPLLDVAGLQRSFAVRGGGTLRAVDGIDLQIGARETLGLVGESGSGKSTTGRLILRLIDADAGTVRFDGRDVIAADPAELRALRRDMQIVFQDPYSSLDPLAPIASVVGEPFEVHGNGRVSRRERDERVVALLEQVGMSATHLYRYPAEFSGGQRQRIAIARALALNPKLIVCDEPVSALDMSTQAQVINLLADLQDEYGLAYLLIAHDLAVVRHASHRIAVMYLGRIVEVGDAEALYREPKHPYTEALLSAVPVPDPVAQRARKRIVLGGDIPSPAEPPSGCRFHSRCPYAMEICAEVDPPPFPLAGGWAACHLHEHGPKLAGAGIAGLSVTATPIANPTAGRTPDARDPVAVDR